MTEWKPTEQNIGQPVLDTYPASIQNNTYIPPVGTLHIGSKWYDVDTMIWKNRVDELHTIWMKGKDPSKEAK